MIVGILVDSLLELYFEFQLCSCPVSVALYSVQSGGSLLVTGIGLYLCFLSNYLLELLYFRLIMETGNSWFMDRVMNRVECIENCQ